MRFAVGLFVGVVMFSASFSRAEEPSISDAEILERYLTKNHPEYDRLQGEIMHLETQQKVSSGPERQKLEMQRVQAVEESRRIKTAAIHILRTDKFLNNELYNEIKNQRSPPLPPDNQKPIIDANNARLKALKVNADPNSTSYFVMDEAAKGTPAYITELKLNATQKSQVIQAAEDYSKLVNSFKGDSAEGIYDKLKVISQGEMGRVKSAEDLKKILFEMLDLNRKLESAKSKDELLAAAKDLKRLTSPHTKALTAYFGQTDYKITFGDPEAFIDKGKDRIFLDEVGKVKRIVKSGGRNITGAASIKKALVTLGLSATALSVSAGAMADEAVKATAIESAKNPPANFNSKDWVKDGAR